MHNYQFYYIYRNRYINMFVKCKFLNFNIKLFTCNKYCSRSFLKLFRKGSTSILTFTSSLETQPSSIYARNLFESFAAISNILLKHQTFMKILLTLDQNETKQEVHTRIIGATIAPANKFRLNSCYVNLQIISKVQSFDVNRICEVLCNAHF